MKNENSKGKAFLLLSMIAFFIMSATFLVMPLIHTNIDSGSNAYNIIVGIIFWLTLIFGMISLFLARKNINGIKEAKRGSWIIKYQELSKTDFSMGSSIFAVKQPEVGQLWYGNTPIVGESPYVVRYQTEDYKRIEAMQKADNEALNNYWQQQPENKEPEFLAILEKERKKQELDPSHRILYFGELGIYRLKKMLPTHLPFEERKEKLVKSEAWNCWINQHNTHLKPEEITENNIDKEIENVGRRWGMDIEKQYNTMSWIHLAMNGAICKVYIP